MKWLLVFALLLSPLHAVASTSLIAPFRADYVALRDGKPLGETRIEWRSNGDGTWTLRTETRGTDGLARLAGLDVVEESVVRWNDGRPETVRYDFRQRAALSTRKRHADVDWQTGDVTMDDNGKTSRYRSEPGMIDRHAVVLAVVSDLGNTAKRFDYRVAMADAVEDFHYTRLGDETLTVPAGRYETTSLERRRGPRTSVSWFAKQAAWLPVQIEQLDSKKGETITLRLKSLQR